MPGDSAHGSRRLNVLEFSRLAPVIRLMINCGCDVRWRLVFSGVSVYKDTCFCVTALASRQVFTSGYEGSANPFWYPGLNRSLIRKFEEEFKNVKPFAGDKGRFAQRLGTPDISRLTPIGTAPLFLSRHSARSGDEPPPELRRKPG